jgi:hypothetical protein
MLILCKITIYLKRNTMACGCKKKKVESVQTPTVTPTVPQATTQDQVLKMTTLLKNIGDKKQ